MSTASATKELTFIDFLIYVGQRKLFLLFTTIVGLACSIFVINVVSKKFTAETTFSVQPLLKDLPDISKNIRAFTDLIPTNEKYIGLLKSSYVLNRLIKQFDLKTHYKIDSTYEAETYLKKQTKIFDQSKSYVHIKVDDYDPRMAANLANAYVIELQALLSLSYPEKKMLWHKSLADLFPTRSENNWQHEKKETSLESSAVQTDATQTDVTQTDITKTDVTQADVTQADTTAKDYITFLVQPTQIAEPALKPSNPDKGKILSIGVIAGFFIGMLIIMFRLASSQVEDEQLKQLRNAWRIKRFMK